MSVRAVTAHSGVGLLMAAWLSILSPGCAIDGGGPWGRLDVETQLSWQPKSDRLSIEGELLTVNDEALALEKVALKVERVRAILATESKVVSFDPANPPPGYSLCHTGHCHKDDGSLPSYEEIKAELAQQTGASAASVTWQVEGDGWLDASKGVVSVPLGACTPSCDVGRGQVSLWQVDVAAMEVAGKVRSTASQGPLSGAARAFMATWSKPTPLRQAATLSFDRDAPAGVRVQLTVELPVSLFDDVVFKQTAAGQAGTQVVDLSSLVTMTNTTRTRLLDDGHIAVSVSRFEP